jgi:hypothetical protein
MRRLCLALLALGCGDDRPPGADAAAADARLAADAPPPDAGLADAGALGRLCATTADGGVGSCPPDLVCCSAGGTTICREPADCPAGPGYRSCEHGPDCQGSIRCLLGSMQFCTKPSACASYGGTEVP